MFSVKTIREKFGQRAKINGLPAWILQVFRTALAGKPLACVQLPQFDVLRIPPEVFDNLYDYQVEGIKLAVALGKKYTSYFYCFIICLNGLSCD